MNTSALILMIAVQGTITLITVYFLIRALRGPRRAEPDSYTENDVAGK